MKKFLLLATLLFPLPAHAQTPGAQPEICVTSPSQTANYNQVCMAASSTGGTLGITNFGSATGGLTIPGAVTLSGTIALGDAGSVKVGTVALSSGFSFGSARALNSGSWHGIDIQDSWNANANGQAMAAFNSGVTISGANNYSHYVSYQSAPILGTSGTTTSLYGFTDLPSVTAGTVTNRYGFQINDAVLSGGGAITNQYAIYISPLAAASNNWGIYQGGPGTMNYFAGNVGIKNPTPGYSLEVDGSVGVIGAAVTVSVPGTGPVIVAEFDSSDAGATTTEARIVFSEGGIGGWYQGISGKYNVAAPYMSFSVNTVVATWAERMRLTSGALNVAGALMVGSLTTPVLAAGEQGFSKISPSGSAPGAGSLKIATVAGTNAGSCKLIAYAGTSTTPVTIVDNVGTGC